MLTQKRPILRTGAYKAKHTYMSFVCLSVQYLVREVTVRKEGPLFQVGVNVSKGGCTYISLLLFIIKSEYM